MKLGAQLYSVRTRIQTPEDVRQTFAAMRDIGYETVQFSGAPTKNAEAIRAASEETGLPVVCTHVPFERIAEDTPALIREHLTIGCPVIGLGAMPCKFRHSQEGLREFLACLREPVARILDAGLQFAYHNHQFEFERIAPDRNYFDVMLESCPDWQWIPDTYWIAYAGYPVPAYLEKIGAGRMPNVHFKDMAADEDRGICACGAGTLDFGGLAAICRRLGTQNVLVEQDNAVDFPDPFVPMRESFAHLRPLIAEDAGSA